MGTTSPTILSIAVVAVLALVWGGLRLVMRPAERVRGLLMLGAAAVLLVNVLLWSLPVG